MTEAIQGDNTMWISQLGKNAIDTSKDSKALKRASAHAAANDAKLDEVAQDFEAVFLSEMLEQVFATAPTDPLSGGGFADETYRSLMVQEYSKLMAKAGGIGIAAHVKAEMLKLQEVSDASEPKRQAIR